MGHWLAECSKGIAQSDIVAACIGADATMSGAYIQSIVTAVAAVIALVAAYLAYRGATASIRYEENIRKGVVKAYAHRLFAALYRVEQQLIGPFSAGNNGDVRLTYRPVLMPAELTAESWRDQALLGPKYVETLTTLGPQIAFYNEAIDETRAKYSIPSEDGERVLLLVPRHRFDYLQSLAGLLRNICEKIKKELRKDFEISDDEPSHLAKQTSSIIVNELMAERRHQSKIK